MLVCAFPASLVADTAPSPELRSTVADLRYGVVLYEYYQDHYFEALSELMVAEQRGGIQGHGDNPALIEGGISLSFGMENKAGNIFTGLLKTDADGEHTRPEEVRNAAWYYLGKLRYLRGDWNGAAQSFARIDGRFEQDLLPELESLAINLSLRRGDLQQAEAELKRAGNVQDWLPYLYFNLGNAYARAGQFDRATDYYQKLVNLPISKRPTQLREQLALYDKGLTAAGYARLLQQDYQQAIKQFRRVRLDSVHSDRALLGYGWAAAENEDYQLALRPWQALSRRPLIYPAVQEAIIAVPFAYEKLNANGQALASYQNAEVEFERAIQEIGRLMNELNNQNLLQVLDIKEEDSRDWFMLDENNSVAPELTYLTELFSLNQFQGAIQELRDILHMAGQLDTWREKLEAYRYMLDQREINRDRQTQQIAGLDLHNQLAVMQQERDGYQRQLNRIVEQRDYLALVKGSAEGDEKYQAELLADVKANIDRLQAAGEDTTEYEAAYRRYHGLLYWQAAQAFPDNRWRIQRTINQLDQAMEDAQINLARFDREQVEAPDIVPYRQRINTLSARLDEQLQQVNAAAQLAENTLRQQIKAELLKQKKRLQHYLSQARLAVARLYDQALLKEKPPGPASLSDLFPAPADAEAQQ